MSRVACTVMQKNEDALLRPWLEYHGHLFGFENLYVFDNGSTHPGTLSVLEEYRGRGVHLDTTHASVADYADKGEIIAARIRALQDERVHDALFPLDCDEFVVLKQGEGATVDGELIHAHVDAMREGGGLLRVGTQFFNVINRPGEFAIGGYVKTAIILDGTFRTSDHGHHYCQTTGGSTYRDCEFAYVHYHYKPLAMLVAHARAKLAPFVDVDDPAAVAGFDGPGYHLRSYLTMTEAEFAAWHGGDSFYRFTAFNELLASLPRADPVLRPA